MSDIVIRAENLSKAYRIGLKEEIPDTLAAAAIATLKSPFKSFRRLSRLDTFAAANAEEDDLIWALNDVSFELRRGDVLGVIGRNGSGKSTLLKILSRITFPTSGRAVIHGRVSSLLEVGTGFHPELTGRENVYMNGTILGMRKREIDRKFEEIVEFSGVSKFLDTPVKRYSSGMKVRLAFAVAAHLEPEVLIIDEVLAVGDAEFQRKCLGKMHEVAEGGRTVLFVSHNMTAVRALCTHGLLLSSGRKLANGEIDSVVAEYEKGATRNAGGFTITKEHAAVELRHASVEADRDDVVLRLDLNVLERQPALGIGFELRTLDDTVLCSQGAVHSNALIRDAQGATSFELCLKGLMGRLTGGTYQLHCWVSVPGYEKLLTVEPVGEFDVPEKDPSGLGKGLTASKHGALFVETESRVATR